MQLKALFLLLVFILSCCGEYEYIYVGLTLGLGLGLRA